SLTLEPDDTAALPRLPLVDESRHICLTPLGGRLRLAGTAEFNGFDAALPAARVEQLRTALRELLPAVAEQLLAEPGTAWCGFRPMTSDTVPVIGATPVPGLYLNTGHGHLGWTFCAGSGRAVADLVTGREPALNILPYSLARFG
ncbi:MAG: FAD-dependent oxidoreductase, partial [Gammaproteobacteria bacterium]|nr:FAD-dependent oxidoreductase [Gammaproteobacteria bacterium]